MTSDPVTDEGKYTFNSMDKWTNVFFDCDPILGKIRNYAIFLDKIWNKVQIEDTGRNKEIKCDIICNSEPKLQPRPQNSGAKNKTRYEQNSEHNPSQNLNLNLNLVLIPKLSFHAIDFSLLVVALNLTLCFCCVCCVKQLAMKMAIKSSDGNKIK